MTAAAWSTIDSKPALERLCLQLSTAPYIAFDTEFVSEHTYRPQLCLVQVSAPGTMAAIDAIAIGDMQPFWNLLAEPNHDTLVHAGRGEFVFCYESIGRPPARLFDVQIAAGLVGNEYPAGYGSLVSRVLGKSAQKGETRTDWRRRPLSAAQIQYAMEDVRWLPNLREELTRRLEDTGRFTWFEAEMAAWQSDVIASFSRERWRKVAGAAGLTARQLAVVREVWRWREGEAEHRDRPAKTVLRDDLIVEIARRQLADPKQLAAVRGMERGDLRGALPELGRCVERAMKLATSDLPHGQHRESNPQLTMVAQLLGAAMNATCRQEQIAASMVATTDDIRDLIDYHLHPNRSDDLPALTQGWRGQLVGQTLRDLLDGRVTVRVGDLRSDQPLAFERRDT